MSQCTSGSILCHCRIPEPDEESERGDQCIRCGKTIGHAVIGGKVHAGYNNLGNGQEFFEQKENGPTETSPDNGTVSPKGYYRDFMSVEVVLPPDHDSVHVLGTEHISIDTAIMSDGEVVPVVLNRRVENLPSGPKFPIQDSSIKCSDTTGDTQ